MLTGTVISATDHGPAIGERQPSHGTVWSVGGPIPSVGAVNDGHGRFIHSGTNARLFPTLYAGRASRSEDDDETHESRLACALDIDQARRIIATEIPETPGPPPPIAAVPQRPSSRDGLTIWNGVQWENTRSLKGSLSPELLLLSTV